MSIYYLYWEFWRLWQCNLLSYYRGSQNEGLWNMKHWFIQTNISRVFYHVQNLAFVLNGQGYKRLSKKQQRQSGLLNDIWQYQRRHLESTMPPSSMIWYTSLNINISRWNTRPQTSLYYLYWEFWRRWQCNLFSYYRGSQMGGFVEYEVLHSNNC